MARQTRVLAGLFLIVLGACSLPRVGWREDVRAYIASKTANPAAARHAPVFLVYDFQRSHNRIGRPRARLDEHGQERIYMDPASPAIYYLKRQFSTSRGLYTNFIYRVHFPEVPVSLIPFHLSAGRNSGLMVVVTVDESQKPVLVTTVHTCGCYLAIVPTHRLPESSYPRGWRKTPLLVYGEELPRLLDYSGLEDPRLLVHLRPGTHRVMHLEMVDAGEVKNTGPGSLPAPLMGMGELEKIPLNGGHTSLYHGRGVLRGHVKGAFKLWETILLGLPSQDLFVGMDKAYQDPAKTNNPFYTSLKPWNRKESDMWDFAGFLRFWGWGL